jgi:drug/metabolite transporter (DMT)-like permease
MESWFVDALLVTLSIGIVAFVNKVFAKRKYDQRFAAIILYGIMSVIAIGYGLWFGIIGVEVTTFLLIVLFGVFVYFYSIIMMTALRYLPTSVYFVNVRLISSFVLLFVGIIFFEDSVSIDKWIGFFVGVVAMVLLFEKDGGTKNVNYKKGIWILILGAVVLIFSHALYKSFASVTGIVPTFLLITFLSAFLSAIIFGHKQIKINKQYFKEIFVINLGLAILYFYYFVMLFKVYAEGALGISYKIQSYSPFIPIVLAAIVYKEKISFKKKIALVLVAISLWFFM